MLVVVLLVNVFVHRFVLRPSSFVLRQQNGVRRQKGVRPSTFVLRRQNGVRPSFVSMVVVVLGGCGGGGGLVVVCRSVFWGCIHLRQLLFQWFQVCSLMTCIACQSSHSLSPPNRMASVIDEVAVSASVSMFVLRACFPSSCGLVPAIPGASFSFRQRGAGVD